MRSVGLDVNPTLPAGLLTPVEHALLGLARAFSALQAAGGAGREVLVLDEPTAALPETDVERLFAALRLIASRGAAVLLVSHRIREVLAVSDRITVLRDGRVAASIVSRQHSERELAVLLIGSDAGEVAGRAPNAIGKPVLRVTGLRGGQVDELSFEAHAGEILGFTGLAGMGQDELPYLLVGARHLEAGTVEVDSKNLGDRPSPRRAFKAGVTLVPADRRKHGGLDGGSMAENITVSTLGDYFRAGRLRLGQITSTVDSVMSEVGIRPHQPSRRFSAFSGGNQQKALIARGLQAKPRVLLLHEPTHGIDVAARENILRLIADVAADGVAVVLVSVEYDDLARLCDRVLVMERGKVISELVHPHLTERSIAEACLFGVAAADHDTPHNDETVS
jgi:ribose transport system ATP-binding protein